MATSLSVEEMKQIVRDHFEDFVNNQNAGVIRKNMTPDFYDHDGPGGKPTGVDGDEQMMVAMYKSMPDLHLTIEDMIAEGDKVMCRNIWRWTDTASGKKMQFHGFVLWRFEGDKIAERGPLSLRRLRKPRKRMSSNRTRPNPSFRSTKKHGRSRWIELGVDCGVS